MITLTNMVQQTHGYDNLFSQVNKDYADVKLSPEDIKELKPLIPEPRRSIQYELRNASTALANGWRRTVVDEIPCGRLTSIASMLQTSDKLCEKTADHIIGRIRMIPTSFIEESKAELTFAISVENKTEDDIYVTSNDIVWTGKGKCPIEWNKKIDICMLGAVKTFKMSLFVDYGINRGHATFLKAGNVSFRPLAQEPFPPSSTVHFKDYKLGVMCQSLIDPKWLALHAWKNIAQRLQTFLTRMEDVKTIPYTSPHLDISSTTGNRILYKLHNETYTISQILAWYAYQADKSLPNIVDSYEHPQDLHICIWIDHADHITLLKTAATAAIKDIKIIIAHDIWKN